MLSSYFLNLTSFPKTENNLNSYINRGRHFRIKNRFNTRSRIDSNIKEHVIFPVAQVVYWFLVSKRIKLRQNN